MDAVSALLRTAMGIATARAALVAFDDEALPLAVEGCSEAAAHEALQAALGTRIPCRAGSRPATLVVLDPAGLPGAAADLEVVANEIGHALIEHGAAAGEERAALAADKQRLVVTLKAIADAVITALPDGRVDFINEAAKRLLNVTFADAYGHPLRAIADLRDAQDEPRDITLDPRGDARGDGLLRNGDRKTNVTFVSSPIRGANGAPIGYVIVLRDVTAQFRLTRRLAYEASHDPLTRLPNRRRFEEILEAALESSRRDGSTHTVAFIDLDHFKSVNDTYGHQAGDTLLRDIAMRMSLDVRGNDIVARIGGDEFAVLLHECTPPNARRVAEKIRDSVQHATLVKDGETIPLGSAVGLGASVGLAAIDRDSESAAASLAAADQGVYAAKAAGRNTVVMAGAS